MATTPNFGWETPDDTDYVKDGAAAMRTLGNSIDASLLDLKGGTTGQVLSKNSNTDMDFVWVTENDADAIQNTIVDAKGDLITATAADTPARLAVGTNGQVLTADSTTATGLKWATAAAGGGMTLIATATPSGATSLSFTSIPTTYKQLVIAYFNVYQSTFNVYWNMRFNSDSGTNYRYSGVYATTDTAINQSTAGSETSFGGGAGIAPILGTDTSSSSVAGHGTINIYNANSTTAGKMVQWNVRGWNSVNNTPRWTNSSGYWTNTTNAITSIEFVRSGSQTLDGGTFLLFGIS